MTSHLIPRFVMVLLLAACAPADAPTAPAVPAGVTDGRADAAMASTSSTWSPRPGTPRPITRFLLEYAANGLLYTSESDYPFSYFFRAGPVPTPLTVRAFRAAIGVPDSSLVEELSLDDFFARHIERVDPADSAAAALVPRYVFLRETVRNAVQQPRVFRVGLIAIKCYIVGTDRQGNIVGLTTIAIET